MLPVQGWVQNLEFHDVGPGLSKVFDQIMGSEGDSDVSSYQSHGNVPILQPLLGLQAELGAELALAWGQLFARRLDVSRQAHIGQDRGQPLGDATSIPSELRCAIHTTTYR